MLTVNRNSKGNIEIFEIGTECAKKGKKKKMYILVRFVNLNTYAHRR